MNSFNVLHPAENLHPHSECVFVCLYACVCVVSPRLCLISMSFSLSRTHILFPLGSPSFLFIFLRHNFLHLHSPAAADTRSGVGTHAGGSLLPCQVERTHTCLQMRAWIWGGGEGGGAEGRGWKVRVQQLWIIDTGQDGEFSRQSCQLIYGCFGSWRRPSGARFTV